VGAVVRETGLSQSNVSNHLARLRALGWVTGVREGRQVLYHITDYFVEQFVRSQERPGEALGIRRRRRIAGELLPVLVTALSGGAEGDARHLLHEALLRGLEWRELYLHLLTPALRQIGDGWQAGRLSVGDEHQASAIVVRLMARVFPGAAPRAQAPTVVVACVAGNRHEIGARMAADFFAAAGWRVRYLGADTPTADLTREGSGARVVALSASMPEQLPALREAAAVLRRPSGARRNGSHPAGPAPLLVAGGLGVVGLDPEGLGVDVVDRYLPRTLRRLQRCQQTNGHG
jgi:methanogenic corrinoid protein MtbC1